MTLTYFVHFAFIIMTHHMWIAPFTCVISGPTSLGKTVFILRLLKHVKTAVEPPPGRILYCYGIFEKIFSEIEDPEFSERLRDQFDETNNSLVIIDDLMHETNDVVSKLFSRVSHHTNTSVIFITQNIFHSSTESRTIALNTQYLVIFKSVRDKSQIAYLARQMYPTRSKHMVEAYTDATSEPYSYLFLDLKPNVDDKLRLKACIFPDDQDNYVYVSK